MFLKTSWLVFLAAVCLNGHAANSEYMLKAKFAIGGEGGWDYLTYDPTANRLFIARGNRVQVINPDTGALLGEIPDTPGVHGVALAPDVDKGFTSNGRDNSVTVFDLTTLRTLRTIKTPNGENPDFINYDAASRQIFAFNGRSHNATVIDALTDRLVATVALSGKPEAAVADGQGKVFVNIEDRNEISVIDAASAKVSASWALKGCDEPAGLAIDTQTHRLFVGCHNKTLLVVDADLGKVIASLPIGAGVDANAFDPQTHNVFSSQGDGTLTIIKASAGDKFNVIQNAITAPGARTLALNPTNHAVYLVSAEFNPAVEGQQRRSMKPGSFTLLVMKPAEN